MRLTRSLLLRISKVSIIAMLIAGWFAQLVPQQVTVRDTIAGGKQFPCQGGTCGCQTAEQCWSACCCTTREYRIKWAQQHKIEVDPELIGEQKKNVAHSCCSKKSEVARIVLPKTNNCCHSSSACCETSNDKSSESQLPELPQLSPWECQGQSVVWAVSTLTFTDQLSNALLNIGQTSQKIRLQDQDAIAFKTAPLLPPPEAC